MKYIFKICFFLTWGIVSGLSFSFAALAEKDVYLHQIPQVTGITFKSAIAAKFRVATPYGIFVISADGKAESVSRNVGILTELVAHPTKTLTFFSSGYKSKSVKLGVVRSDNGGLTWRKISASTKAPVAFRAMAISSTDPLTMYGVDGDFQMSRDGGKTWASIGPTPGQVFDIAISSKNSKIVYAATEQSLQVSRDGGRSWQSAYSSKQPATMVNITPAGRIHAFIYKVGLVSAVEPELNWTFVAKEFQDRALMDIAINSKNDQRLLGVADTGAVMISSDGGKRWTSFEGNSKKNPRAIARGKVLYEENCQVCHGVGGIGENPKNRDAKDEFGFKAPALNDDAHAWHHSDGDLSKTILNGSPRNQRMIPWKGQSSAKDVEDIVVYMKSLWSFRSLACQGGRHMKCMR